MLYTPTRSVERSSFVVFIPPTSSPHLLIYLTVMRRGVSCLLQGLSCWTRTLLSQTGWGYVEKPVNRAWRPSRIAIYNQSQSEVECGDVGAAGPRRLVAKLTESKGTPNGLCRI